MKKQIAETRMEIRAQSNRLDGIWWKIGLLAGIVSLIASEVFGEGIGAGINTLIGWWPI